MTHAAVARPRVAPLTPVLLLLAAAVVAAVLVPAAPAAAADDPDAARLLRASLAASLGMGYAGTKYVAAWRSDGTSSSLVDVRHAPGGAPAIRLSVPDGSDDSDDSEVAVVPEQLEPQLLDVLDAGYDLARAGTGRCAGREADVVEARRPGSSVVAARFWLDRQTALLLRREVYDASGRRVGSSAFLDVQLPSVPPGAEPAAAPGAASTVARTVSAVPPASSAPSSAPSLVPPLPSAQREALQRVGWTVPDALPGGFVLYDARVQTGDVLQVSWTDGLSTTALFVQRGRMGPAPAGFAPRSVGGAQVWARGGAPERLVWAGAGDVLTLVSDAPEAVLAAAVEALPHDARTGTGVLSRLRRGLARLAGWLNPFD